jgi:hypothetical protein
MRLALVRLAVVTGTKRELAWERAPTPERVAARAPVQDPKAVQEPEAAPGPPSAPGL